MKAFLLSLWQRRSRRLLCIAALGICLPLLHPFIRQSIFGPQIDGIPWCVWEDQFRAGARVGHPRSWMSEMFEKLGLRARDNPQLDLQSAKVVPLLMHLADDSDVEVRRLALRNLPYHKENFHAAFAPIFERHLHDPDEGCRLASARGLWAIKKERDAIAVVIPLRESPDRHTRWGAIELLSNMASLEPTLFDILAPLTEDSDPSVCSSAIQAMGHFGKRGVPIIQQYLRGMDNASRFNAIYAASHLREGKEEVYPDLLALQADPNEGVARNASHALYMMDPKRFPKPATWGD